MPMSDKPALAMIVAMAQNRVIGRNNQLPWHLPNDLKYFKTTTMGKPVIMGRKTFQSIGRPLPGRTNIVVSRDHTFNAEGVWVAQSVEQALQWAEEAAIDQGVAEMMVIGGAQIYAELLPRVERLYLTQVQAEVEGDSWFPAVNWQQWRETSRQDFQAGGDNPYDYSFQVFQRKD
jgi:dihydrofolate reductase